MADEKKIGRGEMIADNDTKLVELAFDYISAETEPQANQVYEQAVEVVTEITIFTTKN